MGWDQFERKGWSEDGLYCETAREPLGPSLLLHSISGPIKDLAPPSRS